ncbi:hypothetical protein GCM10025771_41200 [Niveibacterium umoris]|uniref:Uncharacterized protein n=2 Tax=Niveibacterium umoris TaxID=1193620 RepID=A0A840BTX4_9RHOO|nr:hypothetical protein [Niveibacterium umoris]MBB4014958.1 hypothetical protein [Niveibacterium umoris]
MLRICVPFAGAPVPVTSTLCFIMNLITHIHSRLKAFGVDCAVVGNEVHVQGEHRPTKIRLEEGWEDAYKQYKQARSITFDLENLTLVHNNSVEVRLVKLSSGALALDQYALSDLKGNAVTIGGASIIFALAFFDSPDYEVYFKARVLKRLTNLSFRRVPQIMWMPTTATYTAKGRRTPPNLREISVTTIKNCLFKIAVEQHDCFAIWKPSSKRLNTAHLDETSEDHSIPRATYDENVVSFYKVAKASPFPSQSFLAYYHVLEYYFLRVSEDLLHHHLTAMLNDPKFRTGHDSLDKLISTVRGQDARSDETEMLRNVLYRFVQETELIEFIAQLEEKCGEKLYTKKRKVFGEHIEVSLRDGHALSNAATALKHVRNAIVHSSDRYKREECHIPLSDSENTIEEFIPLVRFFAEKVIYGTAS